MAKTSAIGEQKIETQQIHKLLLKLKDGEILTYETILTEVGVNCQESARGLLRTAIKNAEADTGRIFDTVRTVGVKRLEPEQSVGVFSRDRESVSRKARRSFRRSARVDYEALTQDAKNTLNAERTLLHFMAESGTKKKIEHVRDAVNKAGEQMSFAKTLGLFAK